MSDDLRERVLAEFAKHEVQHGGRRVEGSEDRWEFPCKCGVILRNGWKSTVDEHVADAVLAVVQPELDEARAALARVEALAQKWRRGYGYEDDSTLVEQTCADRVLAALRTPDGGFDV